MLLSEAKTECARRFRDPNNATITGDAWEALLNAARREFLTMVPHLAGHDQYARVSTVAATRALPLPAGFTEYSLIHGIWMPGSATALEPMNSALEVYSSVPEWLESDGQGEPDSYIVLGTTVLLAPIPDAIYSVDVYFRGNLAGHSDDATAFPEPAQYHDAYIEGALERRYADDGKFTEAGYHRKRFIDYSKMATDYEPGNREERYPALVDDFWG